MELLREALASGDAETVEALKSAPIVVAGYNQEYPARQREDFRKMHATPKHKTRETMVSLYESCQVAIDTATIAAVDAFLKKRLL
jgi:hypothetical protein